MSSPTTLKSTSCIAAMSRSPPVLVYSPWTISNLGAICMNDPMREQVLKLLQGGQAHITLEDVLNDFPPKLRGVKPNGAPHTAWQLVEHLRIAQWDILGFSRSSKHL